MSSIEIQIQCRRCRRPFLLVPGANLADFCSTCRRFVGRRMEVQRQLQMNRNYHFQRDIIDKSTNPFSRPNDTRPFTFIRLGKD